MKRLVFSFLVICFFSAAAQTVTLDDAIQAALKNNVQVRQGQLLVDAASVNFSQARSNMLPSLNAALNHGLNHGRSIDPFTNQYVNQNVNYGRYDLGSEVVVFNGLSLQNAIQQQSNNYQASKLELQQSKDNLVLNVVLAYLTVLSTQDQLASARQQAALSQKQLERLQLLDEKGAINPSQVSDLRGQLMNEQLAIATLQNQLEVAKLTLSQLMNVPYTRSLDVQPVSTDAIRPVDAAPDVIYEIAAKDLPLVQAAELRKEAAIYNWKAIRGQLYPSVVLSGGMQTNYSSVAQNAAGKIPYNDQIKNNVFSSVNVGVRVPLFNGRTVRNRMKLADIEIHNSELLEENARIVLKQQVEQAHLNMTNAYDRYQLLVQQVQAFEQSFRAAEARFNAGVGTTIDYLTAKTNLDRARINLISAQYDFLLRKRVLDYYVGQ